MSSEDEIYGAPKQLELQVQLVQQTDAFTSFRIFITYHCLNYPRLVDTPFYTTSNSSFYNLSSSWSYNIYYCGATLQHIYLYSSTLKIKPTVVKVEWS